MTDHAGDLRAIRAAATDWAARIDAGAMSDDQWTAFAAWMAESEHLEAFEAVQRRLSLVDAASVRPGPVAAPDDSPRISRRPAFVPKAWMAAPVGGLIALGLAVFLAIAPRDPTMTFAANGGAEAIVLPDHTAVTLRSGSRLQARYGARQRDVALTPGSEATFDVTKDPSRPFVIALGARNVRVVGTAFDIVYRPELTRVSVSRGVVEVSATGPDGRVERLRAGQAVTIRAGGVWTNAAVRPENVGAWRQQRLFFDQDTLDVVASSIAEATDVRVVVQPDVRSVRFTGVLRLGPADQMAKALELYLPVRARVAEDEIVLDRRAPARGAGRAD